MKITNTCKIFETLFFKNQKWNQTETAFRRQRLNIFYAFILRMLTYCIQTDYNVYIILFVLRLYILPTWFYSCVILACTTKLSSPKLQGVRGEVGLRGVYSWGQALNVWYGGERWALGTPVGGQGWRKYSIRNSFEMNFVIYAQ